MKKVKCVAVGDAAVGKTALLSSYTSNAFPIDYTPTLFETFTTTNFINGKVYEVSLWDTAGEDEFGRLRSLSYAETDVFLVVFSTISTSSFKNVREKWIPEIKHFSPQATIVLCATKTDLREDQHMQERLDSQGLSMISTQQGEQLRKELKAFSYVECSSLRKEGLKEVFDEVCLAKEKGTTKKKGKGCVIS